MSSLILPTSLFFRLNGIENMPKGLLEFLKERLQSRTFNKKELVLTEGEVCRNVYFIEKGLVRIFVEKKVGKNKIEITTWVLKENDIFISVDSFFDQVPATENIQCQEKTTVYYISFEDMEEACARWKAFEKIRDKIKSEYYAKKEKRDKWYLTTAVDERYKYMMNFERDFAKRVIVKVLSSYLQMSTKTFYELQERYGKF